MTLNGCEEPQIFNDAHFFHMIVIPYHGDDFYLIVKASQNLLAIYSFCTKRASY